MNEQKEVLQEKKPNQKLKMTFAIVILAALFIVELYLMMEYSNAYLPIGVIGVVMLCMVYFITDLTFKMQNERNALRENEYENLFKSQKVSYILMKQSFMEMAEVLEEVKTDAAFPVEELVKAQKGTAKVTIQRSKENATAIMNSNDKMLERILSMESNMNEINNIIKDSQNDDGNTSLQIIEDILAKQNDILSSIAEIKSSMKKEISKVGENLENNMSETTVAAPETPVEETVMTEEPVVEEEPIIEEEPVMEEEPIIEEEPAPGSDSNHVMTPEEIAAILGESNAVEEKPEPEPIVEEKPSIPDSSDPGHVMTPEEIAALLANT